jgi:hypothetical protein
MDKLKLNQNGICGFCQDEVDKHIVQFRKDWKLGNYIL